MEEKCFILSIVLILFIFALVGIWNNWLWIGKDGYSLPHEDRPGFFRFWFNIVPRFFISGSMENHVINIKEIKKFSELP